MESYSFLLFLAIIMISTKILGLFTRKIHMPAVVGALVAGVILGPSCLNLITLTGDTGVFLEQMAEIGVILLMFNAGLETDLSELKKNGVASFVTALIGVVVPLLGGFLGYAFFFHTDFSDYDEVLKAVFVGVVLTATSVSITVETLREMGKLKGKVGTTILGAAVIDDIIGIIVLTIVTSLKDTSVSPITVVLKIVLYFVFIAVLIFVLAKLKVFVEEQDEKRRTAIICVALCFILSYISEEYFGIADITGAYFAGLMLCTMKVGPYVARRCEIPSYLIFSPVFFASVGLKVTLGGMDASIWIFAIILLVIAILSKVVGCGLGAKMCGCTGKEAFQVGIGMISRGEVALIVAQKGYASGMLDDVLFAPIVLVVIVTTLITPILLKLVMKDNDSEKAAA
ncbi:cation:proton antiporter [Roseburia hominis]|uniref:cation:proton antiporter n=1 Tax=Roseburia hominis TaxID=301301 RepID=UPI0026EC13D8|nr:cation:proton antiporter [Roseburia hominis]MCI7523208.1 cation:proton antiporter [Roseburia hominis]